MKTSRWVFSFDKVCDMLDIIPSICAGGLAQVERQASDAIARGAHRCARGRSARRSEAALQPARVEIRCDRSGAVGAPAAAIQKLRDKVAANVGRRASSHRPERCASTRARSARKLRKASA